MGYFKISQVQYELYLIKNIFLFYVTVLKQKLPEVSEIWYSFVRCIPLFVNKIFVRSVGFRFTKLLIMLFLF